MKTYKLIKRFEEYPEALVFLTNERSCIGGGHVVEFLGIGRAEEGDEMIGDEDYGKPFIHALAIDLGCADNLTWYYYNANEILPLTPAAREAWAELLAAQGFYQVERAVK